MILQAPLASSVLQCPNAPQDEAGDADDTLLNEPTLALCIHTGITHARLFLFEGDDYKW